MWNLDSIISATEASQKPRTVKVFREHAAWDQEVRAPNGRMLPVRWWQLPSTVIAETYLESWEVDEDYSGQHNDYIRRHYAFPVVLVY